MTIERLRELNLRLTGLLDDPQPGLFTWHEALHTLLHQIHEEWTANAEPSKTRFLSLIERSMTGET